VEPDYDEIRLRYSLCSSTLGRMCLSGKLSDLDDKQNALLDEAIAFYKKCVPVIKKGHSKKVSAEIENGLSPEGYQAIVRRGENGQVLVTVHAFAKTPEKLEIQLPAAGLSVCESFIRAGVSAEICGDKLYITGLQEFEAAALLLQ
jgi:alpha-galactosidase